MKHPGSDNLIGFCKDISAGVSTFYSIHGSKHNDLLPEIREENYRFEQRTFYFDAM